MLVVSSKVGETITIDGDIYITVLQHKENGISVAIDAPEHTVIGRINPFKKKKDQL